MLFKRDIRKTSDRSYTKTARKGCLAVAVSMVAAMVLFTGSFMPAFGQAGAPQAPLVIGTKELTPEAMKQAEPKLHRQEFSDKGINIELTVKPLYGAEIVEGELTELRFRITDSTTGNPIQSLYPGSWVDARKAAQKDHPAIGPVGCADKIRAYFKGIVAYRPLIDLNGYYVLAMNNDASINVIDPYVSLAGKTSLFTVVHLRAPAQDWTYGADERNLFVTLPRAGLVAVVNIEKFEVSKNIAVGKNPQKIALQPDKRYIWVSLDSDTPDEGGVAVIDASKQELAATIKTGAGRHTVAFSDDSLFAFVTNSGDGTLSVIDVQKLAKVTDIKAGTVPSSVTYSSLSKSAYVTSEGEGTIRVIGGKGFDETAVIRLKPGLQVMRFAPGDRWGFAANGRENVVSIIDASNNTVAHTVEVMPEPDQITFSRTFAFIHSRADAKYTMIDHTTLGKAEVLRTFNIPGGEKPPGNSRYYSPADMILPTFMEGHILIVNPADEKIYYYMEGMDVAMGSFRSYGGQVPRAVLTVNRNLRPVEPGVYASTIRVPGSGDFEVAIFLDSPKMSHCFTFTATPNPTFAGKSEPDMEVLNKDLQAAAGEIFRLKVRIYNIANGKAIEDAGDLVVQTFHAASMSNFMFAGRHTGEGVYEVPVRLDQPGVYYLVLTSRSKNIRADSLKPVMLIVGAGK